jgi:hypothetical protein
LAPGGGKRGKRKRGDSEEGDRKVINQHQLESFKLKEDEDYRKTLPQRVAPKPIPGNTNMLLH